MGTSKIKVRFTTGIDIGGTFTDLVAYDRKSGKILRAKVLTTPEKPEDGVIEALRKMMEDAEVQVSRGLEGKKKERPNATVIHATTLATNIFLGQKKLKLPCAGFITTWGFRDIIEIGRQKRPRLYDVFFEKPPELVPRKLRFGIRERTTSDGKVLLRPDPSEVRKIAEKLKENGVQTVAVCFINSYINPTNEKRVKSILQKELGVPVVASYEVNPEYREYERSCTTLINALLVPLVSEYISGLERSFSTFFGNFSFFLMQSSGGVSEPSVVRRKPASLIESGPTAGVIAVSLLASKMGIKKAISFDMGGTTAKAGVVIDGKPEIITEYEVGGATHYGRIVKGSGYPVRHPFVDLAEVSAGGGTIAGVDEAGKFFVGPESAGADPGPACYGKGGEDPTVSDANLILGRLPEEIAGGQLKLKRELAEKAVREKIVRHLLIPPENAAEGIIKLCVLQMVRAIRLVSSERGLDPRKFTLFAYGGAGPLHACEVAQELGIKRIVIPKNPGLFSATGLISAPLRVDVQIPVMKPLSKISKKQIDEMKKELLISAEKQMSGKGKKYVFYADMRLKGQSWEILVEVPHSSPEKIREVFRKKHISLYGFFPEGEEIELVNLRCSVFQFLPTPSEKFWSVKPESEGYEGEEIRGSKTHRVLSRRKVFSGGRWEEFFVFSRDELCEGMIIPPKSIVEEYDSTTFIPEGWEATVDKMGNIIMKRA